MGIRLDRLIKSAQTDKKITAAEAAKIVTEVKANGTVSATEKAALTSLLAQRSSKFEPAARTQLEALLQGGPPPPPPPGGDPYAAMTQKLTDAAAGGLTGNELAAAEKAVSTKYGSAVAKEVLTRALGARIGDKNSHLPVLCTSQNPSKDFANFFDEI